MSTALPDSRRQQILDRVRTQGEVQVKALAERLDVSPITIRRDIAALAEQHLLHQVRGGARRLDASAEAAEVSPVSDTPGTGPRIAMLAPSFRYYWPRVLEGAGQAAQRLGIDLDFHMAATDAEANHLVVDQIAAGPPVDALVIAPEMRDGAASDRLVERLAELPFPVVFVERGVDSHGPLARAFDTVRSDHSLGAASAVRHLVALGHRRLAYLGDPQTPTNVHVADGYARALRLMELEEDAARGRDFRPYGKESFEVIDAALDRFRAEGTTAVLVHSDSAATMLLQHATRRGWSVPRDFSLIAYDDELSVTTRPALTAIAPAKHALGERALELALRRIHHPDAPIEHTHLLPALTVRDSTAPPATPPSTTETP
ncbi:LacI family DNA-binding transcriptional regulator [Brachybacterium sp. YJGR34]|uniref:LacI family DNA-binding transcriptional regulator n=1 Tax=Brachybacterium sp. YJGR34 TaxID=2059911 RepID=UPI000E0C3185|nr:LacI family DNA-binding transcriptional regulator [Brachybacterium sp. YJGR34]